MFFSHVWLMIGITGRLLHVFWQMLHGAWHISRLKPPMVTIFGGSRLKHDDPYFGLAYELASRFVAHDISVVTGGGPGAMEAANCGADNAGTHSGRSIGIGVEGLGEAPNKCSQEYLVLHYFFARKWLMTRFTSAFVVFPGGFGTLDELFEIVTLIQTDKLKPFPLILFGVDYWTPLIDWIKKDPLSHGLLHTTQVDFFIITDDVEIAFQAVKTHCMEYKQT